MTIDEAIAKAREVAEKQRKDNENCKYKAEYGCKGCADYFSKPCIECAKEHEQLAEWLEELKAFRENKFTRIYVKRGYNKAIDDFTEKAMEKLTEYDLKHVYPHICDCKAILRDIAEQLKAGDTDGR